MLHLSFATGTEPGKWLRRHAEIPDAPKLHATPSADPFDALSSGQAHMALMRLPDPRLAEQGDEMHTVVLYDEVPGVAVPTESVFAKAGEPLGAADLSSEVCFYRIADDGRVDIEAVRENLQVVATGIGVVIAPFPLINQLAKKQVTALECTDDTVPATKIALVWRRADDSPAIQEFVGITRGRTANSAREETAKKLTARQKARAKQVRNDRVNTGKERGARTAKSRKKGGARRRR